MRHLIEYIDAPCLFGCKINEKRRSLPEDLFTDKLPCSVLLGGGGDGPETGGKSKNCQFLTLSPPAAPAPTPTKSRGQRSDPREKYFYGILILWLFLQFLNFKWESWNTDVDMKRFIVAVCHYSHRPCCYYRWGVRRAPVHPAGSRRGCFWSETRDFRRIVLSRCDGKQLWTCMKHTAPPVDPL